MRRTKTFVCCFGGGGGGAKGFQEAKAELHGEEASFELLGSFDNDPYACRSFEYFTGVPQVQIDARELTPALFREFFGNEAPFAIQGSPPCQGASKLLSTKKSKEAKYELLNELALVNTRLILEAWASEPPAFIFYENVPNITARSKPMLAEVRRLLKSAGYELQDGFHECRHVGDLAQRRKRWFLVARNPKKVPAFLYLPPKKKGKVCGDVLSDLPMPGAPEGGAMHKLPEISALNWWRLWAIPAGGDWRDLIKDGRPRRERFRRHHLEKWSEPSVTIGGSGSNGPCGIADPRSAAPAQTRFHHVDKVTAWDQETGTVTHSPAPSSGAIAVADPRFKGSLGVLRMDEAAGTVTSEAYPSTGRFAIADPIGEKAAYGFGGALGVLFPDEPSPTVTGKAGATTGRFAVADRQSLLALDLGPNAHDNLYHVVGAAEPAKTVTGATRPGSGAVSYAAPLDLSPQRGNEGMHYGKYVVVGIGQPAKTVTGAGRVGSGAQSVAQPLSEQTFRGRWGVLCPTEPSGTVTGNARIATGSNAIAAPVPLDLVPKARCFPKGYAVIDRERQPSLAIAATTSVGCGTYSITDAVPALDLALGCAPRAGAYGVIADVAPTVIGRAKIDNSTSAIAAPAPSQPPFVVLSHAEAKRVADGEVAVPFVIVDPARPDEPLAIIDDMQRPPYRWEGTGKKRKRVAVPLVLIADDGTWHRPLTTLELAVLQGLPWRHEEKALDFGGGATSQRTLIGNMIPMPVGAAIGRQLLMAALAAEAGSFFLAQGGGGGVWVRREERAGLVARGVRTIRPRDVAKLKVGELGILDDTAPCFSKTRVGRRPKISVTMTAERRDNIAVH